MWSRSLMPVVLVVMLSLATVPLWAQAGNEMPPISEYAWILEEMTPEQQQQLLILAPQLMQTWYELTAEQQTQVKAWGKQAQECWGQLSAEQRAQVKTMGLQLMEWWLALSPEQQGWVKARAAQTYDWWGAQPPERQEQLKGAMEKMYHWYTSLTAQEQVEAQAAIVGLAPRVMQVNADQWGEMLAVGSAAVIAGTPPEMLYEGMLAMLDAWGL